MRRLVAPMACRVASPLSLRFARPLSSRAAASSITLWHNPNCSKSRDALGLLERRGEPFQTRQYLEEKPTMSELRDNLLFVIDLEVGFDMGE